VRAILRVSTLVALAVYLTAVPSRAGVVAAEIDLELVENLDPGEPIAMAVRPADAALYVAEKGGRVRELEGGEVGLVLNISDRVSSDGERGLLGIAFSPDGDTLYVNYTNLGGDTLVKAYPFTKGVEIDPDTGRRVIKINQPFANHNGGNLAFGPDGYLYIGMGDGGSQNDPGNRAQSLDSLLGKMLRIDPRPAGGYNIPQDNPYVDRKGRDEVWARGLRNPWRYSFDDLGTGNTGDLWIGDVGGGQREEVDHQPADSGGRENYGWRKMEGTLNNGFGPAPASHDPPVFEYDHSGPVCAITGGYVYRGSAIAALQGAYLYADFCEGEVVAFDPSDPDGTDTLLGEQVDQLASFGRGGDGELYVLSLTGTVSKIVPAAP
jgi:glucose/arabinose dehydrogenase